MPLDPNFQHLRREEHEPRMHFSHLHQYVSAYEPSPERLEDLRQAILQGLVEAKRDTRPVIVDQDGEMFIVCYPAGSISLCLRWKSYELAERDELEKVFDLDKSPHGPFCEASHEMGRDNENTPTLVFCGLFKGHEGPCEYSRAV